MYIMHYKAYIYLKVSIICLCKKETQFWRLQAVAICAPSHSPEVVQLKFTETNLPTVANIAVVRLEQKVDIERFQLITEEC